jgi:hypothetical protein
VFDPFGPLSVAYLSAIHGAAGAQNSVTAQGQNRRRRPSIGTPAPSAASACSVDQRREAGHQQQGYNAAPNNREAADRGMLLRHQETRPVGEMDGSDYEP